MFSQSVKDLQIAVHNFAKDNQHEYITTEHLLFGMLDDNEVATVLRAMNVNIDEVRVGLVDFFKKYISPTKNEPTITRAAERVFRRAAFQAQASQVGRLVEPVDILAALMNEYESFAVAILNQQGLTRLHLLRYISEQRRNESRQTEKVGDFDGEADKKIKRKSALQSYATNLNEKAKNGKIDPLIGRDNEILRVAQILARRRKNNPLLVGDAGVGKTAIAEGLASLIVKGQVANVLADCVVYALDLGSLVAGTKYRGDFEARIKDLLAEIKQLPNAILFIDEIHAMIGAGSSQNGSMDVSNLLKPALANGELRCIGATTFVEYRQVFEKDNALSRRFQKVDIHEPSIADTIAILHGLKSHYETFHHVKYEDDAIQAAVELSVKHIHGRFLPDKAIDVIDEVGARQNLDRQAIDTPKNSDDADNSSPAKPNPMTITTEMVEQVIAHIARIPPKSVSADDKGILKTLASDLKQLVFEQDDAVDTVVDAIMLARAGLKSENKPIGSFLLAGPTGVGKTEVCRQLARLLGVPLVRFDMSEYMEAHTVSRLIGSPPGYVGHDKGGLLTEKIEQNPHCVLLLDELEKAHSDVFNLLLQVMDNGALTDTNGRTVSFRQVILMMTSNVGAFEVGRESIGFVIQNNSRDNFKAMEQTFKPEFRNRLDAVVQFAPLKPSAMSAIVDKFLDEVQRLLDDKGLLLKVDEPARQYFATQGYDPKMGARPMARLIQDKLKKPIAQKILFDTWSAGDTIVVGVFDDNLTIDWQKSDIVN